MKVALWNTFAGNFINGFWHVAKKQERVILNPPRQCWYANNHVCVRVRVAMVWVHVESYPSMIYFENFTVCFILIPSVCSALEEIWCWNWISRNILVFKQWCTTYAKNVYTGVCVGMGEYLCMRVSESSSFLSLPRFPPWWWSEKCEDFMFMLTFFDALSLWMIDYKVNVWEIVELKNYNKSSLKWKLQPKSGTWQRAFQFDKLH